MSQRSSTITKTSNLREKLMPKTQTLDPLTLSLVGALHQRAKEEFEMVLQDLSDFEGRGQVTRSMINHLVDLHQKRYPNHTNLDIP